MTEKKEKPKSTFQELKEIDIEKEIKKKNKFNYLSWAWALDKMYEYDEDASFEFLEREIFNDGTVMIYCVVTIKGKAKKGFLPVMNYKNEAVKNPNARQISDAMQRCLVKTIALHGLGLWVYAGEDLPDETKEAPQVEMVDGQEFLLMQNAIKGADNMDTLKTEWAKIAAAIKSGRMNEQQIKSLEKEKDKRKLDLDAIPTEWDENGNPVN